MWWEIYGEWYSYIYIYKEVFFLNSENLNKFQLADTYSDKM